MPPEHPDILVPQVGNYMQETSLTRQTAFLVNEEALYVGTTAQH